MEIKDSNRMIAEWMQVKTIKTAGGGTLYDSCSFPDDFIPVGEGVVQTKLCWHNIDQLKFHSDWSWLMPVWFKMQLLIAEEWGLHTSTCEISQTGVFIECGSFRHAKLIGRRLGGISHVYSAVVAFIQFYNSTKTTTDE